MSTDIQLRIVEADDVPFLHELFNNPNITDFWFEEPYTSVHSVEQQFDDNRKQSRSFILETKEKERAGLVGLYYLDQRHRHGEFAIALHPDHQGKGYATEATKRALDYAFLKLNLRKVFLYVVKANEKARHIYEKIGFVEEGCLKEHYFINGSYHDAIMMRMFASEYKKD